MDLLTYLLTGQKYYYENDVYSAIIYGEAIAKVHLGHLNE